MRKKSHMAPALLRKATLTIGISLAILSGNIYAYDLMPAFPKVDLDKATVGGISSGAYFAAQFHVAWSSKLIGVGVIAGGPWGCANGNLSLAMGRCMEGPVTETDITELVNKAHTKASSGKIDDISNMANDQVFLISGTEDITTTPSVMNSVKPFYERLGIPNTNIKYVNDMELGHAMPTINYGNDCKVDTEPPWISNCDYDAAGDMLKHFYATDETPLNPRVETANLTGDFIEFDQSEFTANGISLSAISMNEKGVLYVPKSCQEDGEAESCRLHVFFHGCEQNYNSTPSDRFGDNIAYDNPPYEIFGDKLWKNAGLNEWADSNDIVIMYPQWKKTTSPFNPKGCNDWWGYTTSNYDEKNGPQMLAIQNMMEKISADKLGETAAQVAAREAAESAVLAAQLELLAINLTDEAIILANQAEATDNINDFRTPFRSAKDKLIEAITHSNDSTAAALIAREKANLAESSSSGSVESAEANASAEAAETSAANALAAINTVQSMLDGIIIAETQKSISNLEEANTNATNALNAANKAKQDALDALDSIDALAAFQQAEAAYNNAADALRIAEEILVSAQGYAAETTTASTAAINAIIDSATQIINQIQQINNTVKEARDAAQDLYTANLGDEAKELVDRSQAALEQAQAAEQDAAEAKAKADEAALKVENATSTIEAIAAEKEAAQAAQAAAQAAQAAQAALADSQSIAQEAKGTAVEVITQSAADNAANSASSAQNSAIAAEEAFELAKGLAVDTANALITTTESALAAAEAQLSMANDPISLGIAEVIVEEAQEALAAAQELLNEANSIDISFDPDDQPIIQPIVPHEEGNGGGGGTTGILILSILGIIMFRRKRHIK